MDTSNATSDMTAMFLANAHPGRFQGLVIRKVGKEAGRGADKKRYGDDLVHVILFGGFKYHGLVDRSRQVLQSMDPAALVAEFALKGIKDGKGEDIRLADVCIAIADLDKSFNLTLEGENESTSDHVYEPLVVDGKEVRGCKVYKCVKDDPDHECKCRNCTGDPRAAVPGQINLMGLKIGETVLETAVNGPIPASKSRADVVAKNIIRNRLPIGRLVSYRLEAGADFILRVGPDAAAASTKDGVTLDSTQVAHISAMLAS